MNIAPVNLGILEQDFAQLERHGVVYGYGVKAPTKDSHGNTLALAEVLPSMIRSIDCSGYFRWAIARATKGLLILPDGSQNQRAWFEVQAAAGHVHKVEHYPDVSRYLNEKRFFPCFIKPYENGCGKVGHVWGVSQYDDGNNKTKAGTLESHGGGGCISRPWNYPTLLREVYSVYELPTVA